MAPMGDEEVEKWLAAVKPVEPTTPGEVTLLCSDVEATITDIPPGLWTVEYCWDDYELPGDRCHLEMIVIQ